MLRRVCLPVNKRNELNLTRDQKLKRKKKIIFEREQILKIFLPNKKSLEIVSIAFDHFGILKHEQL